MRFLFYVLLVLASHYTLAQSIQGYVRDSKSGEGLAFVHVLVNDSRSGTTTDIDGRFQINTRQEIKTLRLSYVGYAPRTIDLQDYLRSNPNESLTNLQIVLTADTKVLRELVFEGGENPAHPIIRQVVSNRKINNPEKIKSFRYKSYNKFYVDAESFSDDEDEDFTDFIATKYLFMMESVTERKYLRPDRSKEVVIANRVSGFRNPMFTTLANSFQPFSFYDDYIKVAGKRYLNPISTGTLKKYFFELRDSIYSNGHKVYIISFEPRKRNFDGLKGLLYINTYKYAVENVIAETANLAKHFNENLEVNVETDEGSSSGAGMEISADESDTTGTRDQPVEDDSEEVAVTFKIQQKYELMGDSLWFPMQLNTDIWIGEKSEDGGALKGIGRSYLQDVELLAEIKRREFDRVALEFDPKANKRDSAFWSDYRVEPMDKRGFETYHFIDSVGKEAHLDRYVTGFAMLTTGKLRTGKIDWDLKEFITYNRFEFLRLGAGAHTNELLSSYFNLGGYVGYGFRDKEVKYGADVNLFLTRKNEIKVSLLYQNDVTEFAGTQFYLDNNPLSTERNRRFMVGNMDYIEKLEGAVSFYFLKYLDARISVSQQSRRTTSGYTFAPPSSDNPILVQDFDMTEMTLGFKYSFREKYIEVFGNKVSTGTRYPVIWFNYTRGFEGVWDGQYNYERFDLKIQKTFETRHFGQPAFAVKAGFISGETPGSVLFNGNGSRETYVPLEASNSFQTMRLAEFLSDKYIAVYYTHNIGKVVIHPQKSVPEFLVVGNAAWGELEHPEQHLNYTFNTMERGYYEAGLAIRDIYRFANIMGVGIGGYYRLGHYSTDDIWENTALKLTIKFALK